MLERSARLGFHMGNTLLTIAETYHTLMASISEMVQNSIDANASWIRVIINQKTRGITIQDNGDGTSEADFNKSLAEICASKKPKGKFGRFGKGLISPFGKCERYTVTSLEKPKSRGFLEWTFDTKELLSTTRAEDTRIPIVARDDLCFGVQRPRHDETLVNWRAQIRIQDYTKDRTISRINLEELDHAIAGRYAKELRARQIDITLTVVPEVGNEQSRRVRAASWRGYPLGEVTIVNQDGGETIFRLYLAAKNGRGVSVGEYDDPFRLEFALFARAAGDLLPRDVVQALTSPTFEGEILSSRAKLHSNRQQFEENDALAGLCAAIREWYKEVGQPYLEDLKEEGRSQRYKETLLEALRGLEQMFKNPMFASLRNVIESFKRGTIGDEHADLPPSKVVGKQDISTTSIDGRGGRPLGEDGDTTDDPESPKGDGGDPRGKAKTPRKGHIPLTTDGDGRQRRTIVKSDSLGLQIRCEAPVDSDKLYELDTRNGILRINTRHPQWVQCEINDEVLIRFQRCVVIEALTLASSYPSWMKIQELYAEEYRKAHVFMLVHEHTRAGVPSVRPKK